MELMSKKAEQGKQFVSEEHRLLHDIKLFIGSFVEEGNLSVMKVMNALTGKRSKQLDDIINRLEKY